MRQMHLYTFNFKKFVSIASSILIITLMVIIITRTIFKITWRPKENLYYFYQLEDNSLDVINVGSSHVHCSINPLEIYKNEGITSYNLSAGFQSAWYSYYYVKEALKTQNPRVIVLDVFTLRLIDDTEFVRKASMNLLAMKPSLDKWNAIKASNSDDEWNIFWGFPQNHIRYRDLGVEEYDDKLCLNMMGYTYMSNIEPIEEEEIIDISNVTEVLPISEKSELYLRKTIELCQGEGIDIVLVNSPWPHIKEEDAKRYNYIEKIADEYNVDFINGCLLTEELGIDYSRDNAGDGGHLNYNGSIKWSDYLGKYLKNNYNLPDHRNEGLLIWRESQKELENVLMQEKLETIQNAEKYMECLLENPDYAFAVIFNIDSVLPYNIEKQVKKICSDASEVQRGYLIRMPDGQIFFEANFTSDTNLFTSMNNNICKYESRNEELRCLRMQFNSKIADERTEKGAYFIVFHPFRYSPLDTVEFKQDKDYERE